jgi:hypothetical protein
MKKILFILTLLTASSVFATDRFVDPNLGSGNGTTLFTTITSAVNAAANGDRILIVAGTYNEPTLVLNKSLVIIPQVAGTYVYYNGNITIAGFPGMNLSILGFRLGIYSVTANAITGGSASNRVTVNIVDSRMTNLTIDQDYYEMNAARCQLTASVTFRFGNFVVSKCENLNINDEPNSNINSSKILVACDSIMSKAQISNDDYPIIVANNILNKFYLLKWNTSTNISNKIFNNDFVANSLILIAKNPSYYNIIFTSNYFTSSPSFLRWNKCCWDSNPCIEPLACNWGQGLCWGLSMNCSVASCIDEHSLEIDGIGSFSTTVSVFPTPNSNGFFQWTYNGIDLPCTIPTGSQPLVLTKIIGTTGTNVNTGNPNHDYYDIDLTINDRGRTGGPYSILNYNPTINPSNGKAYVFDLEIPADLFPGQQIDIKAKGYHRN